MIDLSAPQRQSPLAIVFLGLRIVRSIGVVQLAIAGFFLLRGALDGRLLAVLVLMILALVGVSALGWWRYTFRLEDGDLVVNKGVIRADTLVVPIERVQSLSIEQELLHRFTGLVRVSVDTAGSSDAEFVIDAVTRPVAEQLQRTLLDATPSTDGHDSARRSASTGAAPVGEHVVFTHESHRLLVAALTMSPLPGLLLIIPLLTVLDRLPDQASEQLPDVDATSFRWWWIPAAVVAMLAFSVALNLARVFLQDWNLTLRAGPSTLRRTAGLLTTSTRSTSVPRIQLVSTRQNPLQRRAGIRNVELSIVGQGDLKLVGCDDVQIDAVSALAGVAPTASMTLDRRVHPAQIWLAVRNTTIVAVVLALLLVWIIGWWSTLTIVVVPVVWLAERRHVRNHRWSVDAELATSNDMFNLTTEQASLAKTNAVTVRQSLFERRRGLATMRLLTAAGSISVGMIPIGEAEAVRDVILRSVETDHRAWI